MTGAGSVALAVVGEFDAEFRPHPATNRAIEHAARGADVRTRVEWVPTPEVEVDPGTTLGGFDALWIAPGSPYESLEGGLRAIRFARVHEVPLLGTCGGFQHVVLEYARNVLGFREAGHAEYDPYASSLFVTELSCSLAGRSMPVTLDPDSRAAELYGATEVEEEYYCDFGLNPDHRDELHSAGLRVVGRDEAGEARVMELPGHPFFVATLFVPPLRSTPERPHPLVRAFLEAAAGRGGGTMSAPRAGGDPWTST